MIEHVYEALEPAEQLAAMRDDQRAERSTVTRKYLRAGRLAQRRITEAGEGRVQWCVDGWEAVAAEVSAELGISRGRAGSIVNHGLTLLERLPTLATVCLDGDVELRVFHQLAFRTGLITDPEILAKIDAALAARAPLWNALSEEKIAALIDRVVLELDPEAQRIARERDVDRHVHIASDKNGMADLWGKLRAVDGAALDKRLDEIAATVCRDDPRTKAQRRADAMVALAEGASTLGCRCATDGCPAVGAGDGTPSRVIVHVLAEAATVSGEGSKPGYLAGFGTIPAETVRELASRATLRQLVRPGGFTAESRYRPSRALTDFVMCRDLTCRFPGCDVPAERCDVDHTVPFPVGPTHASNLKLYCRIHHLLKTFYVGDGGWREVQYPDGTVTWIAPSGRTCTTTPTGSLFFPQLAAPTGELIIPNGLPPPRSSRSLVMPTRRRTRAVDRAARVEWERGVNRAWIAAHPPPF